MMRSLFSGVAGLKNHQTRMDVVGNNIANVNTVGYKAGRTTFQDVLSQSIQGAASPTGARGGINPIQIGLGMGIASVDNIFTDGSFQATGKNTDLSIGGYGFFMVRSGNETFYTRAGNFDFDTNGDYVVPGTGLKVVGWNADKNGNIDTSGTPGTINIPIGTAMEPKVSTSLTYANNLKGLPNNIGEKAYTERAIFDSLGNSHLVNTKFVKVDANTWLAVSTIGDGSMPNSLQAFQEIKFDATGKLVSVNQFDAPPTSNSLIMSDFSLDSTVNSTHTQSLVIFDDAGNPKVFNLTLKCNTDTPPAGVTDTWSYTITEAGETTASASGTIGWDGSTYGTIDSSGNFTPITSLSFNYGNPAQTASIDITAQTGPAANTFLATYPPAYSASTAAGAIDFNPDGGANPLQLTLDFSAVTQYADKENTINAIKTDGYAAGTLDKATVLVDANGVISGRFSNGQIMNLGQVALAMFSNPSGLLKVGSSLFSESSNSGVPQIGVPGSGGLGSIQPGTLEMSNVDLSEEFTSMIVTQRGFQANSKIITVSDTMLDELVNLKR